MIYNLYLIRVKLNLRVKYTGVLIGFILFNFVLPFSVYAQDSISVHKIKYDKNYKLKEGIYLDFDQVKYNNPVSVRRIISPVSKTELNFFKKLLANPTVEYYDEYGNKQIIETSELWGYCKNNGIYIYQNGSFNRIPFLGKISHYVATKTVIQERYPDPYYGSYSVMTPPTQTSEEMRQYLLNFDDGRVYEYTAESVALLIKDDEELSKEFQELRRRKKRKLAFFYLRRYNERNPLYFYSNP